jgi:uncharacterized protein YbjT (DUF2867 family)
VNPEIESQLQLALPDGAGRRVLLTGATGYIGGRLVPELLAAGFSVRVTARNIERLHDRPWFDHVECAEADLLVADDVASALDGVHTMLYLVHSMGSGSDFVDREARMAHVVADAAEAAGISQIVFLGGLHPNLPLDALSPHMRSREQVGRILLASSTPTLVFQAGIVIGSGSVSFEMIRHLAERLPFMVGPSWLGNRIEPIAIRDVLYYLAHAAALPSPVNRPFEIGCGHPQRFASTLVEYAEVAGLSRRTVVTIPIPAQRLSGFWIGLVTPIPRGIALPIAASMAEDAVAEEHDIDALIPRPPGGLTGFREACRLALARQLSGEVSATWDDDVLEAASASPAAPLPSDPEWSGHTVFTDTRERRSSAAPDAVWRVIEGIGGRNGWYSAPSLWRLRGLIDQAFGGYGLARGRTRPEQLRVDDHVDWWRVEAVEPGHSVTLRGELRAGGRSWLQFTVEPFGPSGSLLRQRAVFIPSGLLGRFYWRLVQPFHALIFPTMSRRILEAARGRS